MAVFCPIVRKECIGYIKKCIASKLYKEGDIYVEYCDYFKKRTERFYVKKPER